LTPWDVSNISSGYYRYSITVQDTTGSQQLIYTDQNRSIRGFVEVFEGPLPTPQLAIEMKSSDFTSDQWGNPLMTYLVSQTQPGAAQRENKSGRHTLAIYCKNFSGEFFIDASLENSPPVATSDWFTLDSITALNDYSGVKSIQFTGNFMWLRFYFKRSVDNLGTIEQVLLKT
jgi:hypothetical protein